MIYDMVDFVCIKLDFFDILIIEIEMNILE